MKTLDIKFTGSSYRVFVGEDIVSQIGNLFDFTKYDQFVLITDEHVYELHGPKVETFLYETNKQVETIVVEASEYSKSLETYEVIITTMIEASIRRNALVVAFGGGMVGDLAGFVAATYLRGIDFIQVPTTLLAHDSSVGGKVAINHPLMKNSIGAFYQPKAVIYDLQFLQTLQDEQWLSGIGEILKHAELAQNISVPDQINEEWIKSPQNYLVEAIITKRDIVQADPFEKSIRRNLNYGHTFAHALETFTDFNVPHGIAVIYGLIFCKMLEGNTNHKYSELVKNKPYLNKLKASDFDQFWQIIQRDKKLDSSEVKFLLKTRTGFEMTTIGYEQALTTFIKLIESRN